MHRTAETDEFMRGFEPSSDNYRNYKRACKAVSAKLLEHPPEDARLDARQEFYVRLLAEYDLLKKGLSVADLGGGNAWFIAVLAQMGLEATLVDDFWGGGHVEASA